MAELKVCAVLAKHHFKRESFFITAQKFLRHKCVRGRLKKKNSEFNWEGEHLKYARWGLAQARHGDLRIGKADICSNKIKKER